MTRRGCCRAMWFLWSSHLNGPSHVTRVRPVGSTSDTDALDLDRMKQVRSTTNTTWTAHIVLHRYNMLLNSVLAYDQSNTVKLTMNSVLAYDQSNTVMLTMPSTPLTFSNRRYWKKLSVSCTRWRTRSLMVCFTSACTKSIFSENIYT